MYCQRVIKFFDREGWAVGVAVRANKHYRASKSVGQYKKIGEQCGHHYNSPKISFISKGASARLPRCDKVSRASQ